MKKIILLILWMVALVGAKADETKGKKVYECRYLEHAPFGVSAWAASEIVKNEKGKENRFVDYNSDAAKALILDANATRQFEKDKTSSSRETSFYMAYDQKGWYLYIDAQEPLIQKILDETVDQGSAAANEGYEIFFVPGLHNAAYYQTMTHPFAKKTEVYDWGTACRTFRSLKPYIHVESLPLEKGFGTFVFVPWQAFYDRLPLKGDYWRFTIIRWMPFGKAGGVTWGGAVHDTGNFGLIHFVPPTPEQKIGMEKEMLRAAWFKFLAASKWATAFWSDEKLGDSEFYWQELKPLVDQYLKQGSEMGNADEWTVEAIKRGQSLLGDWMEFDYKVQELRREYLLGKYVSGGAGNNTQ